MAGDFKALSLVCSGTAGFGSGRPGLIAGRAVPTLFHCVCLDRETIHLPSLFYGHGFRSRDCRLTPSSSCCWPWMTCISPAVCFLCILLSRLTGMLPKQPVNTPKHTTHTTMVQRPCQQMANKSIKTLSDLWHSEIYLIAGKRQANNEKNKKLLVWISFSCQSQFPIISIVLFFDQHFFRFFFSLKTFLSYFVIHIRKVLTWTFQSLPFPWCGSKIRL